MTEFKVDFSLAEDVSITTIDMALASLHQEFVRDYRTAIPRYLYHVETDRAYYVNFNGDWRSIKLDLVSYYYTDILHYGVLERTEKTTTAEYKKKWNL